LVFPRRSTGLRILIIEWHPGLRDVFRTLFERDNVDLPATPAEALRYLTEHKYDLVILDEDDGALEQRWEIHARPYGASLLIAPSTPVVHPNFPAPIFLFPKPFSVRQLLCAVDAIRVPEALL